MLEDSFDPMMVQLPMYFFRVRNHVSMGVFTKVSGWSGLLASDLFEKKTLNIAPVFKK